MEQNPQNRTPPPSSSPYLTAAIQPPPPPPPQQTAYLHSGMLPENHPAAPQGFLPFYNPNQSFGGFHANTAAGFGQAPPPRSEALFPAAASWGLRQNQGESGSLFMKPLTENKEKTALESRRAAVLMGELEAMCGNAPPAATTPPPSAVAAPNAGGDSDIDDEDVAEITECMEEAVKQVMARQQTLHENFIEKLEKMDQKRRAMDEEWRKMEMERIKLMASFKEKDKAISMEREEIIFGYLEKVTGQTIRKPVSSRSNQRWLDHEVNKLFEIRAGLEPQFNQPDCKIPIWKEISQLMAEAGYQRTAMGFKEKWENMNEYPKDKNFKNSSPMKKAKTYKKLDQLYSKSTTMK